MEWLGAALAFAITMLALSIVVTTTVETIHRIFGWREKGLRLMLGHFYDAVVAPHVARALPGMADARTHFLDAMTLNRAPTGDVGSGTSGGAITHAKKDDRRFLSWVWGGRRLGSLALDDFMARLGDSPFGDAVAQVGRDFGASAIDVVLGDVAHKFDAFGRDASVYFQARARLLSVLVALVIAWQCYVNPFLLFRTFLQNPAVTAKVVELGPKVLEADGRRREPETQPGAAGDAGGGQAAADTERSQRAQELVDTLTQAGVPIGWSDARLKEAGFARTRLWLVYPTRSANAVITIVWLLLGGLLVGLGSPFWRDAVLSLTSLRGGSAAKPAAPDAAGGETDPAARAAGRFHTASQARAVVGGGMTADTDLDTPVG